MNLKENRVILAICMVIAITISCVGANTIAYAEESSSAISEQENESSTIEPRTRFGEAVLYGGTWSTIYINNNGINANVKISVITSSLISRGADVRMLGRNGEVVWIERRAIGVNGERTFWCGSDVVHLQAKAAVSDSSLYPQALGSCDWIVYN